MKKRLLSAILSFCMLLTMAPTVAFAAEDDEAANTISLADATETSGTSTTIEDIYQHEWTVTTAENCITMEQGDNKITATLDNDVLTVAGTGAMPELNNSTETENISDGAGTYPWANLKDSITKIVIGDGVTSIGSKAFIAYTNVTSVNIGKDVSEIGVGALSQLSACTTFNVSSKNSNFTTDATGALFDHSKTKLIAFPCGSSVEEYAIPATVKVISYGAFSRAAHLKTITIPADSSLSTIGYGAFAFTTALETVNVIPASVETIGDIPFAQSGVKYIYCADKDTKDRIQNKVNGLLVDVLLTGETPAIEFTDNGYTYRIDDGKALLVSAPKNEATPTVPSGVTYQGATYPVTGIWKGAFAISLDWTEASSSKDKRNEVITSVVLPDSVTQIGERAFYFCKNLSKITIQANTVSIDYLAFATQNTNGTTVDFSAVTTLQSNGTDKWAGVKTVILNNEDQLGTIKSNVNPNTVAVIGSNEWVMGSDGNWTEQPKTNLKATVDGITWTFDAVGGKATLKAYSPKTVESVTVPSTLTVDGVTYTVTELGAGLFGWTGKYDEKINYNTNIKNVVIPKTVTTIGADMFRYSQNLDSVKIQGESITFKSGRTFSGTSSLKVLDMSAVKSIAFEANGDTYFSNMGSNKSPAVIYVSSSAIMSAVENHRSIKSTCFLAYAVTNGGTFKENPTSNTALATPVKAGYTFDGWYSSSNFAEGTKLNDNNHPVIGTTYYAKWTMISNISLSSDANDAVTYGTPVTLTTAPTSSQWTYSWYKDANGNETLDTDKDTKIKNNSSTLVLNNVSDSGTYWVVVSDGKETVTSNNVTVTIVKADGKASVSLSDWTYGETASKPVPTSKTNGINNVTYQYKVKGADDAIYSDTLPTNAGDYTVKATFAATDNYNEVTATADFIIAKATPAIAIKATPSTLTGGGSVELTVSGVPTKGKLAVTCDNDITVNEKDGKYTYTAQLPNATKDYTFTAKYTGMDNYNDVEKTCVVKVTRKSSHSSSSGSSTTSANTVSASTASNGKVALDKSTAKKGDTVTVTVTPDAGYQLDKLTVTDAKGKTVDVTKKSDGKYTFTMPDSKVTITPTFSKIEDTKPSKTGFNDVASSAWYADAVQYVTDKGLMNGTDDNQFSPNASTTRGMLMTVLARYAGEDTTGGATWYEKGMNWAKAKGVSDGTNPNADITREQLVTMLYRYAGSPKADGKLDSFSDAASISTYAADAMQWAVANGIVNGSNGKLNPQNNATRAQVAAILMRFCEMSK